MAFNSNVLTAEVIHMLRWWLFIVKWKTLGRKKY